MNIYLATGLAVVTVALIVFGLGWHSSAAWHDRQAARRQLEADQRTAADRGLLGQRAPMPTYRGWTEGTAWADPWGDQDRAYLGADTAPMSVVDAMDMASAAYQLGRKSVTTDEVHAEAEAIWAEVQADPEKWGQA